MKPYRVNSPRTVMIRGSSRIPDLPTLIEKDAHGGGNIFWSVWDPTPGELEKMKAGGQVWIGLYNVQPPMSVLVKEKP